MARRRARGRRGAIVGGVLLVACARAVGPSEVDPPDSTRLVAPSTQARSEPGPEPEPAPEVDYDDGFAPPPGLTRAVDALELDPSQLARPEGTPSSQRVAAVEAWSELAELDAPPLATREDDPPCRREHYLPHDARPLRTVELEHDAHGRLIRERVDHDTDGTIDVVRRYTWGSDDRLETLVERFGPQPSCAGVVPGWVDQTEHLYDRHGTWLGAELRTDGEQAEENEWRTTRYDLDGRPLLWARHRYGQAQLGETRRWDEQGRPLSRARFEYGQPVTAERWAYASPTERYYAVWADERWVVRRITLDEGGRPARVQRDDDEDGRVDANVIIEHDEQGRERWRRVDGDRDGEAEQVVETRWDEAGRKVSVVTTGPDGTARETWRYDDAGRLLRWSSKRDEHWAEDFESHQYDAEGREIERRAERYQQVASFSDLSGYVQREQWRAERDERGRLRTVTVLQGELGPNERIEHVYECREPYRRHPRRNPLDHPETAAECFEGFE